MQIPEYWWTRRIEARSNSIATMNNCLYLCVAGAVVVTVNQCLYTSAECICCREVDRVALKV